MSKKYLLFVAIVFIIISNVSCNIGDHRAPDVSGISMQVNIVRFDTAFMSLDTSHVLKGLSQLNKKYPAFLPVYLNQIMNFGEWSDTNKTLAKDVQALITGKDIRLLQDTVNAHFNAKEIHHIESQLEEGFRYIKYYFPDFYPPRVVTFISGLANYGAVTVDTVLGIGLDMFLGKDFLPYRQVANPYPGYMLRQFSPAFIPADCFKVLQQQMFPLPDKGKLLDLMIAYGKQLYFLDKVMPQAPDSVKIGYTQKQLQWCKENEQYIWQYFVQNNLLYEGDMQKIMHYIGPAPSTRGMPSAAPGNIGSWIGWQIVRKYMEEQDETTLLQLMRSENAQQILSEAHYRPH